MRFSSFILFSGLLLFAFSCKKKKDDVPQTALVEIPLITGIQYKDINAQNVGTKGYPNAKTGTEFVSANYILGYPNPCGDVLSLHIHKLQAATVKIKMTLGEYREEQTTTLFVLANISSVVIDTQYVFNAGSATLSLGMANMPEGHYRLNVEYDTVKLYDHIWIDRP